MTLHVEELHLLYLECMYPYLCVYMQVFIGYMYSTDITVKKYQLSMKYIKMILKFIDCNRRHFKMGNVHNY